MELHRIETAGFYVAIFSRQKGGHRSHQVGMKRGVNCCETGAYIKSESHKSNRTCPVNVGQEEDQVQLQWSGIKPESTAWKAAMLTTIPPSLRKMKK